MLWKWKGGPDKDLPSGGLRTSLEIDFTGSQSTVISVSKCTEWLLTTSVWSPVGDTRDNTWKVPSARDNSFEIVQGRVIFYMRSLETHQCTGNPGDRGMPAKQGRSHCQLSTAVTTIAGTSTPFCLLWVDTVLLRPGWGSCNQFV